MLVVGGVVVGGGTVAAAGGRRRIGPAGAVDQFTTCPEFPECEKYGSLATMTLLGERVATS